MARRAAHPPPHPAPPPAPRAERSVAIAASVDPAWPAIHYPDEGVTPAGFAELIGDMIDAGSREHYLDAALYDYEYRRRRADVSFYRELARRRGADRILELGAGTGRVTVPLARDGRRVVAVDRSPEMLTRLRDRVARLPTAVAQRITPALGDLRDFSVDGRFPLAIAAFNVVEHLYTRGEVQAFLQRIAAHLEPGGALVFDVQLPDLAWLTRDSSRRWAKTRFTDPSTGRVMYYSTNHDYDPVSQIVMIRLYYEAAEPAEPAGAVPGGARRAGRPPMGGAEATRVVQLSQRKFFPAELEALVAHAGFRVTARYGDFSFRPLDATADSQVLVCEPVARSPRKRPASR